MLTFFLEMEAWKIKYYFDNFFFLPVAPILFRSLTKHCGAVEESKDDIWEKYGGRSAAALNQEGFQFVWKLSVG